MVKNLKDFVEKANKIHCNKYDYSESTYIKSKEKIKIVCSKHGDFWQTPNSHLRGNGCPKCKNEKTSNRCRTKFIDFIEKANKIHNNKYDYSKVDYVNGKTKICIICPKHGEFYQLPVNHINKKCGCPKCKGSRITKSKTRTTEDFIKKAIMVHCDKYNYSKVNYINCSIPIEIICNKHNKNFWQNPTNHLQGKGCPFCNESKLEKQVENILIKNNILFESQKTWDWLIYKKKQKVDFYLKDYNLVIECQGEQHFKPIKFFGGLDNYNEVIDRDLNKNKLCKEHNLKILYYSNLSIESICDYPFKIIKDESELINEINKIEMTNL